MAQVIVRAIPPHLQEQSNSRTEGLGTYNRKSYGKSGPPSGPPRTYKSKTYCETEGLGTDNSKAYCKSGPLGLTIANAIVRLRGSGFTRAKLVVTADPSHLP
jgi:hypothetical protein